MAPLDWSAEVPQPVLDPDRLYVAYDRAVCGTAACAGETVLRTGRTAEGVPVVPVTAVDIKDVGTMVCSCGRVVVERPEDLG